MKQKDTDKLLELLKKSGSIDSYLKENADFLLDCDIKEYLNLLIEDRGLTIRQVAQQSDLSERYCYQFLSPSNPRNPSRDVLLCLCIGMKLNLDETQTALKIAKLAPLYPNMKGTVLFCSKSKNRSQSLKSIQPCMTII